jgi:dolichyl-phosphate-mannose--protein O-mannosyl transferase
MLARSLSLAGLFISVRSDLVCFALNAEVLLVPFLIMGRVTYLHHYVRPPVIYDDMDLNNLSVLTSSCQHSTSRVLMLSHVLGHFIFSSKRYTTKTKAIIFGVLSSILLFTFWWFKGAAFGISGPIADHKVVEKGMFFFFHIFYFLEGIVNWFL